MRFTQSRFVRQPQTLWLRRALFQVHLWTGLAIGIYILVISVSGSMIVFRREMDRAFCPQIVMVKPSGPRLNDAQLIAAAKEVNPLGLARFAAQVEIRGPRVPGAAVEVWYTSGRGRIERLLDPYTGKDLGDAVACEPAFVSRLADLHDNLLAGHIGRVVNGVGAVFAVLMCLTGAVLWWPGISRWRHSMTLHRHVHWRRFIWELHGVLAFWTFALILMWAVSGVYFAFPHSVDEVGQLLTALGAGPDVSQRMDVLTDWLARLHFGRAFGPWVKALWSILGLVPAALVVTGALMWWNRVLRKAVGRSGEVSMTPHNGTLMAHRPPSAAPSPP